MNSWDTDEPTTLVSMTANEIRAALQALAIAPYVGVRRPSYLTDAIEALTNGAIGAGWDVAVKDIEPVHYSRRVFDDSGLVREDDV